MNWFVLYVVHACPKSCTHVTCHVFTSHVMYSCHMSCIHVTCHVFISRFMYSCHITTVRSFHFTCHGNHILTDLVTKSCYVMWHVTCHVISHVMYNVTHHVMSQVMSNALSQTLLIILNAYFKVKVTWRVPMGKIAPSALNKANFSPM